MGETRLLDPELDLRDALGACARIGHARVPSALSADLLRRLRAEIEGGPFRPFGESFGPVRQQIDGYDIAVPGPGFPLLTALCRELREVVRSQGDGLRGLATWAPNEVGVAHYEPGSIGITPHMDGKWYRRLVIVATVYGRAPFAICGSRDPEDVVDRWIAGPGGLVLLRGPGLAGARDGRPFHLVEGPRRGGRLSLGIRMSRRPPAGSRASRRRSHQSLIRLKPAGSHRCARSRSRTIEDGRPAVASHAGEGFAVDVAGSGEEPGRLRRLAQLA